MAGLLEDFRAKYPQYNNRTDDELESALYEKFYSNNMTRAEFYNKLQAKNVGQQIASGDRAAAPPEPVLKKLDQAIRTVAEGITGGYADRIAAALGSITGVGGKAGDYAGNLKAEQAKTAETPSEIAIPGQVGGAVLGAVAGGGIVGRAAKAIPGGANLLARVPGAVKATIGAATGGAIAGSSQGQTPAERQQNATTGALTGAVTGGTLAVGGKFLGNLGDKIMTSVIRPTTKDLEDGFSLDTIKKFDLGGSLNATYAKTQAKLGELSSLLRQKLQGSSATIDLQKVAADTRADLTSNAGKIKSFGSNQGIGAALDKLDAEAKGVGAGTGVVSIPDAQLVKQASGKLGAWQYGRQDADSGATEAVYNTFYNKLKTAIEKASPSGVKEINQDLSKLIPVNNALIRRMPVADRNYAISLGDLITLSAAWANPHASALTLINLAQKSGTVGNLLSKAGPRIPAAGAGTISGFASPLFNQQ